MYYVYIMSNKNNNVIYIGFTNNLIRRVIEHKSKYLKGFTYKYEVNKLVYYETFKYVEYGIERERQLKRWARNKKDNLINNVNPEWKDLYLNMRFY